METVRADMIINLDVNCPTCGESIELLNDTDLNEEGMLLDQAISDAAWKIPAEDRIDCIVTCPACECDFQVKGVWF